MAYEMVIGLEIHVELATKTKIFCSCKNEFGGEDNTHVCPICTAQPGALPMLNRQVVDYALQAGLALNCDISRNSYIDRKSYHYPDLSKGFQNSQNHIPICTNGYVDIETMAGQKRIGIHEIHMEEDAGKLVHPAGASYTRADDNRAGVPLIEIVTEPDMRSSEEVLTFLDTLRNTLLFLGISDCKMQEGSMRCDVNLSVREAGAEAFGVRNEMKNLNSFRSINRAIDYEFGRQVSIVEAGGIVEQNTLRWDDERGETSPMRSKENAQDYRYFPEPDLLPIVIDDEWLTFVKSELPELPAARRARYEQDFALQPIYARMISASKALVSLFEGAIAAGANAQTASNWVCGNLMSLLKEQALEPEDIVFDGNALNELLTLVEKGTISSSAGRQVMEAMLKDGGSPAQLVDKLSLAQISDEGALLTLVHQVIELNPKPVADYLGGKEKAITSLIGQAMKASKGQGNPQMFRQLFEQELKK